MNTSAGISIIAPVYNNILPVFTICRCVNDRLLRLPMYYSLSERDQDRVIQIIQAFRGP